MFSKEQTQTWWLNLLREPAKLNAWLQKLWRTEYEGYTGHLEYLAKNEADQREIAVLLKIAKDERRHADIVAELLQEFGTTRDPRAPASAYWKLINLQVGNIHDYCAANHYGEALAASRFEVIREMPQTPVAIQKALDSILPDEIRHGEVLEKLAGKEALVRMKMPHEVALMHIKVPVEDLPGTPGLETLFAKA